MKRFLAPLTVALLFGLVMISVVGGVAFGQIVGLPVQPGVGTGFASDCDVTINPGTSTLQTALNNVPATISTNDYVICMRDGVYGGLAQETDFGNTGDNSTHRLVLK